jgi:hypothetical protein
MTTTDNTEKQPDYSITSMARRIQMVAAILESITTPYLQDIESRSPRHPQGRSGLLTKA